MVRKPGILFSLILILLISCSPVIENRAPVLVKALSGVSIYKNTSFEITFEHIDAFDKDGDDLVLVIPMESVSNNYRIDALTITPNPDFTGDIYVPIAVYDGNEYSSIDTLVISVLEEILFLPLETGSWWEYIDSVPGSDTALISRMVVGDGEVTTISGETVTVYDVFWSNLLEEYGIVYRMSNSSVGVTMHGAYSLEDTIVTSQVLYPKDVAIGRNWNYKELQYDGSDNEFVNEETMVMTCTDTAVFVTVPAGTFKCLEFSINHSTARASAVSVEVISVSTTGAKRRIRADGEGMLTEKLYYAGGLGYILNVIYNGDELIWQKALRSYDVVSGL